MDSKKHSKVPRQDKPAKWERVFANTHLTSSWLPEFVRNKNTQEKTDPRILFENEQKTNVFKRRHENGKRY